MAVEEHVEILKQGDSSWNKWRRRTPGVRPDLSGADLRGLAVPHYDHDYYLEVDEIKRDLELEQRSGEYGEKPRQAPVLEPIEFEAGDTRIGFDLRQANLADADLEGAHLVRADLTGANLEGANLDECDLRSASLVGCNLIHCSLEGANLRLTELARCDLTGAWLSNTDLSYADLEDAVLTDAQVGNTIFTKCDLSSVKGLDRTRHYGPSTISVDTLRISKGRIPDVFLKGCGLTDFEIEFSKLHRPNLSNDEITRILYEIHNLRATQSIQINGVFISYSHLDSDFVNRIESLLNKHGIRFWRDVHHATAGPLERQIEKAMRINDTVLLVLSTASVESDWVEHEVTLARRLEKEKGKHILCPVALDNSWATCVWEERMKEQIKKYNVLDFSTWQNPDRLSVQFDKLIEGLQIYYI